MAGFGPVASFVRAGDPSWLTTDWGVGTFPVGSFPYAPPIANPPLPPGHALLAGQIAPTRQAPVNLPALAPFIPAPITTVPRAPNFQRYYDWKRGEAIKAHSDVWQPLQWRIPLPVTDLPRTPNFTRYHDWNRANAQTWVGNNLSVLAVQVRPVLFVVT